MDKTILNQRVRVTEYHYEDSPEREYILLDTATGRVCLGTSGDPGLYESWDEMLEDTDGLRGIETSPEMWLEEWLTIDCRIPADWLDDPEWLEDEHGCMEELENHIGIGEALWLAKL